MLKHVWRAGLFGAPTLLMAVAIACSSSAKPAATAAATVTQTAASATRAPGVPSVLDGAARTETRSATIKVAAASDLRNAMESAQSNIEQVCGTRLTFVFGSSGTLSTQIAAGADFALYLSADAQYPADLAKAGVVVPNGTASYGLGRLVLATRPGLEPITDLKQLTRADIKKIAIANPDHAPYGRAAQQALQKVGVYDQVKGRLVLGENIRQTTDYVEQGNADAAIVAYALVINGSPAKFTLIDSTLHAPIEQAGAVMRGTKAELTARCVLQYILDPAGQSVLKQYGFEAIKR